MDGIEDVIDCCAWLGARGGRVGGNDFRDCFTRKIDW